MEKHIYDEKNGLMYRAVGRNLPPPYFYHNMMHPVISSFDRVVFAFHLQLFAS